MYTHNRLLKAAAIATMWTAVGLPGGAWAQSAEELMAIVREQAEAIRALSRKVDVLVENTNQAAARAEAAERMAAEASRVAARSNERLDLTETQAQQASEQAAEATKKVAESESNVEFDWGPSPTIRSKDGLFEVHVRGRLFADAAYLRDHDGSNAPGGTGRSNEGGATQLREARLGIEGVAWRDVRYLFEVDFADNGVDIKEALFSYKWATVGQFKTQNSLEELTSSSFTTFMERAALTDAFNLDRRIGFGGRVGGDRWSVDGGVFGQNVDEQSINENAAIAVRGHYAFDLGGDDLNVVHVGASTRFRWCEGENSGTVDATRCANQSVRYRQRPFFRTSQVFHADTGTVTGVQSDVLAGGEVAWVGGPLSVQAEAAYTAVQRTESNLDEAGLWGGYIDLSYFITGEHRGYDKKRGIFERVKVKDPIFQSGGFGAVQVAARFDYVNLTDSDAGFRGGEQYSAIGGVNWHLNDHVRFMLNYAHTEVTNGPVAENTDDGNNSVDGVGFRGQIDF